ncbi:MAG: ChrR family anti-sigma-E factor [Pseudomonadota bacterium]
MRTDLIHPDTGTLAAYAAGTLGDGMSLLVAGHLTFCPICRAKVAAMEHVGAHSFDIADPHDLAPDSLDRTLSMLDAPEEVYDPSEPSYDDNSPLPRVIQNAIGKPLDGLDWQFCLPGLHQHELDGFEGESVAIIRARPGAQMLPHTHTGDEATLVLSGAMQDGNTIYRAGDVAQADHDDDHKPSIVGDETCYCLIVMDGGMHFTGRFSRALNLFNRTA